MKKNILVVAADARFRASLARALMAAGYGVELAEGAKRAREVAAGATRIDLGILAAWGGGIDEPLLQALAAKAVGLFVVGERREALGRLAHAAHAEVITSREVGDILARVEDALRREGGSDGGAAGEGTRERLSFPGLLIDLAAHAAIDAAGRELALTRAEFALLVAFARAPGRALTRDQLRLAVTGDGAEAYDRSIDVMVWRLRRKVEDDPKTPRLILTIPGVGYKFAAPRATATPAAALPPAPPPVVPPRAPAPDPPRLEPVAAERRQVTVLVGELAGLAALSARLDLEDLGAVMARWRQRCTEIVAAHHGRIARFLGDGMIAHFGEPLGHEHDAENAVRAALALLAAPPDEDAAASPLALRLGIASGLVVVGPGIAGADASERAAVGEPPNIAARLAAVAEPGALLIAESTHHVVRGLFECRAFGGAVLDGERDSMPIWQVVRPSTAESRFDAQRGIASDAPLTAEGLTPFVGRGRELEVLMRGRERAAGRLTVVDIVGDAGIGKSRLLHEFRAQLIGDGVFVLFGSCWPDSQQTPFRPFIDVVRRSFRIARDDSSGEATSKFATALELLGLPRAENVGLLMNLLGLAPPPGSLSGLDGVLIGLRTRDLLLGLLRERSRIAPLALVIEDVHWIDRASEELLAQLVAAADAPPMLVLNTLRPEYQAPWASRDNATKLVLAPLSAPDTTLIVESRLGAMDRSTSLVRTIVDRAEGNPLFAEEMANFLVEKQAFGGTPPAASAADFATAVPASLQTLLTARVDRLTPAGRTLLQAAAVIGRRFPADLLAAVSEERVHVMPQLLAMAELDLIHRDERSNDFVFKHALVRDALYQSLLIGARKGLHRRVAQEIERRFAARPIEAAEILAHHYAHTDEADKAIEYLALAGQKSLGIYSLAEAEQFLLQALDLLRAAKVPVSDQRAMAVIVDLVKVLTLRSTPAKVVALLEPELDKILALEGNAQVAVLLYFYSFGLFIMCRFKEGRHFADMALRYADRSGDRRAEAYAKAALIYLSTCTEPLSLEDFEHLANSGFAAIQAMDDVSLSCTMMMGIGWNYLSRGLFTDSARWGRIMLDFGRRHRDPRSTAITLWQSAWQAMMSGDYAAALRYGEECIGAASAQVDQMMGDVAIGTAMVLTGRAAEGREAIHRVRAQAQANQWLQILAATDGPLGAAMVLSGDIKAGLAWLEALAQRAERDYAGVGAGYVQITLAEVYLGLLSRERHVPLSVVLKNLPTIVRAGIVAAGRAERLLRNAMKNPHFSEGGMFHARIAYDLGLVYKATKRPELAREQFALARRAASAQQAGIMLAKIDAALAAL